jgi:hypothetical protein
VASVVSAIAACLAAVLSGASLLISGRREQTQWTRETLVETLALFLDKSYVTIIDARILWHSRTGGGGAWL